MTPRADATDVAVGTTVVTARFNRPVAPITGGASFTLTCVMPCVDPTGTVTLDGANRVASFTLTPETILEANTVYTATVTGVESLSRGRAMRQPFVWSFTTGAPDTTRPRVTLTEPVTTLPGPTPDVPTTTAIAALFSEPMLEASIDGTSFTVTCSLPCMSPAGVVRYDAATRTADFAPDADLAIGTTYTARITTGATDLSGNALAGNQAALPAASDYVWTFSTPGPPTVTAVAPPAGATGVAINTRVVSAQFSEAMAAFTAGATFALSCPGPCTSPTGVVSLDASTRIASFTVAPVANLEALTTYTATITAARSLTSGLAMASPYVWSFTTSAATDTTRPRVSVTDPITTSPGPTLGVPTNTSVSAVFTEDMTPATVIAASFTVTCSSPCVSPAGSVRYAVGSRTAVFTPSAALAPLTTYTVTLTTGLTDVAGNALAGNQAALPAASNYVWTFRTGASAATGAVSVSSTNPDDAAIDVCPSAAINATFDVPSGLRMDPLTLNATTFTVTGPSPTFTPVPATSVVLDLATGRIATFTPQDDLIEGTTYTATVHGGSSGVKDMAVPANALASDFTWTFTVGPEDASCLQPFDLGSAAPFGTFGGSAGMTNTGIQTQVNGDIGTIAVGTSSITGFHDTAGDVYTETLANIGAVNGLIYTCTNSTLGPTSSAPNAVSCSIATQALLDAGVAYAQLATLPPGANPGSNLAGLTLAPGVYTAPGGSFMIEGSDLTLDAQGDANAVFVFQMTTTLTVGGPGVAFPQSVVLAGGAQARNVYWQVGSAATINAAGGGTMMGNILAQQGVVFSTAGNVSIFTLNGRALSLNASVTMVNTVINVPAP